MDNVLGREADLVAGLDAADQAALADLLRRLLAHVERQCGSARGRVSHVGLEEPPDRAIE